MPDTKRVVILGGHGKAALLVAGKLKAANYAVDSIVRNPRQSDAMRQADGNPIVLDIETASVDELASVFSGAAAIVFSAGAGGGKLFMHVRISQCYSQAVTVTSPRWVWSWQ